MYRAHIKRTTATTTVEEKQKSIICYFHQSVPGVKKTIIVGTRRVNNNNWNPFQLNWRIDFNSISPLTSPRQFYQLLSSNNHTHQTQIAAFNWNGKLLMCFFVIFWLTGKKKSAFIHSLSMVWERQYVYYFFSLSLSHGKIKSHGHINNLRSNLCTFALDTPLIRQINRHR